MKEAKGLLALSLFYVEREDEIKSLMEGICPVSLNKSKFYPQKSQRKNIMC